MNTETTRYTASDFAKYHAGTMPMQQMHALEKAALEDPFLADALEGYKNTTTPIDDVAAIKKIILQKQKPSYTTFFKIGKVALAVAASTILVVAATWFYFWQANKNVTNTVATNAIESNQNVDTTLFDDVLKYDTVAINKNGNVATSSSTEQNKNKILLPQANGIVVYTPPNPTIFADTSIQLRDDSKETTKFDVASTKISNNVAVQNQMNRYYNQQGNVTDKKGGPLKNVTIKDVATNNTTVTDKLGRFKLQTQDSSAVVIISNIGYTAKEVQLNNRTVTQPIVLDKNVENIDAEVVVTGFSTKKGETNIDSYKEKSTASSTTVLNGKVVGIQTKPQSSSKKTKFNSKLDTSFIEPKWLKTYLKNNLIPVFSDNNKSVKGVVTLVFEINEEGKAINIVVTKSLTSICDSQAINLIKNAPNWDKISAKWQKIVVYF